MRPKRTNIVSQLDKEQLDTLHYIYDYYSKLGMSNQDIAGIAANMFKESSFRHNSKNSSGHRGYVLMSPDMLLAVINAYGNLDPDTLLLFVYDLITGNSKVKGYTNGAGYQYGLYKTGGDAAEAFRSTFERNKAGRQQSRIDYGNQFHNYFNLRSLKQKMGQQPKPIVLQPVSTAVRPIIPLEQTKYTWTGAENVSPYVTGKPIIKLQPRLKLPSIEELMEDSEWEPPFQLSPRGYKDGKSPENDEDVESMDAKNYLYSFINSPGFLRIANNNYLSMKRDYPRAALLLTGLSYITPTKTVGPSYINANIEEYKKDALKLKYVNVRKHKEGYPSYSYHEYNHKTGENSVDLYGDSVPEYSEYDPFFTKSFVEGHELRHALMNNNIDPYSKSLLKDLDWGHDNKLNEKISDVFGLRYLLYKEGIYDSRENKNVTPEQINKLRKKYPKLRPLLKTKDDSRVSFLLNNIFASNSQQKQQYG